MSKKLDLNLTEKDIRDIRDVLYNKLVTIENKEQKALLEVLDAAYNFINDSIKYNDIWEHEKRRRFRK